MLARQTAASFRGNHDLVLSALLKLSNQTFAATIAIHVGGINKNSLRVDGLVQRRERMVVGNAAHAPKLMSEAFQALRPS